MMDFGTLNNDLPTGAHCCRAFTLGWSFQELNASYLAWAAGKKTFRNHDGVDTLLIPDIQILGPMLRLVGVCRGNPLGKGFYPEPRKVWRCVHNRRDYTCGIYDSRPRMCREYPKNLAEGRCEYSSCQTATCEFWKNRKR